MKPTILLLAFSSVCLVACRQTTHQTTANGLVATIQQGPTKAVKLEVVTDDVIHVMASPTGSFKEDVNLIKDKKALPDPVFEVEKMGDTLLLRTATTRVYLLSSTGKIWFTDAAGNLLLSEVDEAGKSYTPITVDEQSGYSFRQVFQENPGEALYGLGQHQSDEFNYKGKNEELYQYNTKVSVPVILSTHGYGLLWNNYSLSRFGDQRPYADLCEVFTLYDKTGNAGALTASYYADKTRRQLQEERAETRNGYEDLQTIKAYTERCPVHHAAAVMEDA